jgi:hypothetical protein
LFLFLVLGAFYMMLGATFAHQPRITRDQTWPFMVSNPEISQAFYGELRGQEDVYQITNDTWFLLYVNIVVPAISGAKEDFVVTILQWGNLLSRLNGAAFQWTDFYEPFAGDAYYAWPSFEKQVGPGTYTIKVQNPAYQGKYSLAIGKLESFPGPEIINTFKLLPSLKIYFFGKPVLAMFYNYMWLTLGIMTIVLILLVILVRLIIRKIRQRK